MKTIHGVMHAISLVALVISFALNVGLVLVVHELKQEIQTRDVKILVYETTVQHVGGLQFQLEPAVVPKQQAPQPQAKPQPPHVAGPDA